MMTECVFCNRSVSATAKFCGPCGTNIRCTNKDCGQELGKDDVRCQECGKAVEPRPTDIAGPTSPPMNTFDFHEDRNSRSLRGAFTDVTGQSGFQVLAALLDKGNSKTPQPRVIKTATNQKALFDEDATLASDELEVTQLPQLPLVAQPVVTQDEATEKQRLGDLFYLNEDGWTLENNDLKAKSKIDFVRRVSCLFLYYSKEIRSLDLVPRNEVRSILNHSDTTDSNTRKWFTLPDGAGSLMHVSETELRMKPPGRAEAKKFLEDIYNTELSSVFRPGKKSSKKGSTSKKDPLAEETDEQE